MIIQKGDIFMSLLLRVGLPMLIVAALPAAEYHVAPDGDDTADGSRATPLQTISTAAELAQPGDTVLVHTGIYREHVAPPRGGSDADNRIVYRAAPGEVPILRGSDEIDQWTDLGSDRWERVLDAARFGDWNPYLERMEKGKLPDNSRQRSLGEVFVDGVRFDEVNTPAEVDQAGEWAPDSDGLRLVIQTAGVDPNVALTEIAVREQAFAPTVWNLGYITVCGFTIEHAANDYDDFFSQSSSSPQHGALSTTGGHHWLIEHNLLQYNKSIGLDFGIQGAAEYEVHGIPEVRGRHLVRGNRFVRNGTTGAIGYKAPFCTFIENAFVDNNTMRAGGHGKAGLKLISYCADSHVEGNYFINNGGSQYSALWLDWGAQGSRVTRNVFINNTRVFIEANHGPVMFDRNVIVDSPLWITDGTGVLVAHNLFHDSPFVHRTLVKPLRSPPYLQPHTPDKIDDAVGHAAYLRVFNNIFSNRGLSLPADSATSYDNQCDWNVFAAGASPDGARDANSLTTTAAVVDQLNYDEQGFALSLHDLPECEQIATSLIDDSFVDTINPHVPQQGISAIDTDAMGQAYDATPRPGPFAAAGVSWSDEYGYPKPIPLSFQAHATSHDEVLLDWAAVDEADWYAVQRKASDQANRVMVLLLPAEKESFYRDRGLQPETEYAYQLSAGVN
jgi:hypothetical protein